MLRRFFGGRVCADAPAVELEEVGSPDALLTQLFMRSFGGAPPSEPAHFAAFYCEGRRRTACAYVHQTKYSPGVFLVGGLCVDTSLYRRMPPTVRRQIGEHGSLSRWLLARSIELLGPKRAVFAYTGSVLTRRDCDALGFISAAGPNLLVQWHDEPEVERKGLVRSVAALGPF